MVFFFKTMFVVLFRWTHLASGKSPWSSYYFLPEPVISDKMEPLLSKPVWFRLQGRNMMEEFSTEQLKLSVVEGRNKYII